MSKKVVYLTKEEKLKIMGLNLSNEPQLALARDIFIIGCEMGANPSDYCDTSSFRIIAPNFNPYIKIKKKKTNETEYYPLTELIQEILYWNYSDEFPKSISVLTLNKCLKQIAEKVGIDKDINGYTAVRTFSYEKKNYEEEKLNKMSVYERKKHNEHIEFLKEIENIEKNRILIKNKKNGKNI